MPAVGRLWPSDDDDGDDGNDDDDSGSDMYGKIVWGKEDDNWYF